VSPQPAPPPSLCGALVKRCRPSPRVPDLGPTTPLIGLDPLCSSRHYAPYMQNFENLRNPIELLMGAASQLLALRGAQRLSLSTGGRPGGEWGLAPPHRGPAHGARAVSYLPRSAPTALGMERPGDCQQTPGGGAGHPSHPTGPVGAGCDGGQVSALLPPASPHPRPTLAPHLFPRSRVE